MHLRWVLETDEPLAEVSAVLEVAADPEVDALYFWALQASFVDRGREQGAGHVGLQWGADQSVVRHVNWGGYDAVGTVLDGTASSLPSSFANPNTRDYPWQPGRPYRIRIARGSEPGRWLGSVTDVEAGRETVVRELVGGGAALARPIVWSEVFADCDAPSVTLRWSRLRAIDLSGSAVNVRAVTTSYQSRADGGCDNTTARPEGDGVIAQVTNAPREVGPGQVVPV